MSDRPALDVVVMAYNEVASLASTCDEILATVRRLPVTPTVIIVDDGSTDGTGERADEIATREPEVRVIHHPANQGLGGVYRTGFRDTTGSLLTFFPADGQFPAEIIKSFLPRIADADLVLGYLPRRSDLVGKALSLVERILYWALLGPMPRFQGIMLIRRDLLARTALRSSGRGWAVVME